MWLTQEQVKVCTGALLTYSEVLNNANGKPPLPGSLRKQYSVLFDKVIEARDRSTNRACKKTHNGDAAPNACWLRLKKTEWNLLLTALAECAQYREYVPVANGRGAGLDRE